MKAKSPISSFIARLNGRGATPGQTNLRFRLASALVFALLFVLILVFWPDRGVFVYEGF